MKTASLAIFLSIMFLFSATVQGATEDENLGLISGTITGIDIEKKSITVSDDTGSSRNLFIDEEATVIWMRDKEVSISGIPAGKHAEVEYYKDESGNLVADWVDITAE